MRKSGRGHADCHSVECRKRGQRRVRTSCSSGDVTIRSSQEKKSLAVAGTGARYLLAPYVPSTASRCAGRDAAAAVRGLSGPSGVSKERDPRTKRTLRNEARPNKD